MALLLTPALGASFPCRLWDWCPLNKVGLDVPCSWQLLVLENLPCRRQIVGHAGYLVGKADAAWSNPELAAATHAHCTHIIPASSQLKLHRESVGRSRLWRLAWLLCSQVGK